MIESKKNSLEEAKQNYDSKKWVSKMFTNFKAENGMKKN